MSIFKRTTGIEKLRSDVVALEARRTMLQQQREAAESALEKARGDLRDKLIASDDLAFDDASVTMAERRLSAIDDALTEIERRIDDGQTAVAAAEDAKAREDEAKAREAAAAKVEQIAVKLQRAIGDVAALAGELRDALPDCVSITEYRELWGPAGALSHGAVVRAVVCEGLFSAAPQLLDLAGKESIGQFYSAEMRLFYRRSDGTMSALWPTEGTPRPLPLSGAVEATVVAPLRQSAALIRSGELPADAPATPQPQREHREAAE